MNLGVFLPNWIGDAAMATPALRALRQRLGSNARIVGICRPAIGALLDGTTWLDARIFFDPRGDAALRGWKFWRALRAQRFDVVLLMTNSLRTALWAWASGARRRIGFVRYGRGPLLTDRLYFPRQGGLRRAGRYSPFSALEGYLRLAAALGCEATSTRLELATLDADERAADAAFARLGLSRDRQPVVFNSGGAFGPAKQWPTPYFAALARRVAVELGRDVLVLCGPKEREVARDIVRGAAHPRVVSLADEPASIGLSKACVKRAELMVTTDSGPRHFAAAFDVPVITLFGPTHAEWSENGFAKATHLQLDLECVPCQQRECPLGHHRCLRDLTIDEVQRAVRRELERPATARAA